MVAKQLETVRLRLRPFVASDLDALHLLWTNPDVRRYLWDDVEISRDRAEAVIGLSIESFSSRGFGFWAVFFRENTDNLIGFCGLRTFGDTEDVEILYGIHPSHWGQGIATEASEAVLNFGFQTCGLTKIYAGADSPNASSFRVIEKLGMTYDGPRIVNGMEAVYYCLNNPT